MSENGAELSGNQKRAIAALLSSPSVRKAAEVCNLSERTLHRYLQDEGFKVELRVQQSALLAGTLAALTGLSDTANETLNTIMTSAGSEGARVRASAVILSERRKAELDNLTLRVENIEAMIGGEK